MAAATRHHARNVRIFGSVVRGEDTDRSDLDLLVEFDKSPTIFDLSGFQSDLEEILEVPVEILLEADTPRLKERIRKEIIAEAVPLDTFQKINVVISKKELETMKREKRNGAYRTIFRIFSIVPTKSENLPRGWIGMHLKKISCANRLSNDC